MTSTTIQPPAIHLSIETPSSAEDTWEALTDPDRVVDWFTTASPVGAPGDEYRLDFGDSAVEGSLVEVERGRRFSYTWRWEGSEPEDETLVTWTVEPLEVGGSRVILEHGGWPETTPDDATRDDHLGYWQAYLEDLAALLAV